MVAAAEQAIRDSGAIPTVEGPPGAPSAPTSPSSDLPSDSVPEQHGRAAREEPDAEAARPGTTADAPEPAPDVPSAREAPASTAPEETGVETAPDAGEPQPRITDKGLPKRTPQQVAAQTAPTQPRKQSANADELRRRLGGFQRGAQHGRRDAAVESGAEEDETDQRGAQSDGGTAEEART